MTPDGPATSDGPHGPPVDETHDLYRCIAYPIGGNQAHAHVYMPADKRKTVARKLVEASIVVRRPTFGDASFPN